MTGADDRDALRRASAHVFVDPVSLAADDAIPLDDDTLHHLGRVLRLREGAAVTVSDGAGRWRPAVVGGHGAGLVVRPQGPAVELPRAFPPLRLSVAIPKGDRVDWMVQKATELGVDHITLLHTERSVVRWKPDRAARQLERLRRIAVEACRQSRRVRLVEIDGPSEASTVLPDAAVAEPGGRRVEPGDRHVAIGPEGGWTQRELDLAADSIDLGPTVLRTETAALAAVTLCVKFDH